MESEQRLRGSFKNSHFSFRAGFYWLSFGILTRFRAEILSLDIGQWTECYERTN